MSIVGRSIASRIRSAAARTINPPRAEGVPIVPAVDGQQVLRQASPNLTAAHADGHLADRRKRHLVILRRHGTAVAPQPCRFGLSIGGPDQSGLANPCLPGQEDGAASSVQRLVDRRDRRAQGDRRDRRGSGTERDRRCSWGAVYDSSSNPSHRSNDRWVPSWPPPIGPDMRRSSSGPIGHLHDDALSPRAEPPATRHR